MEGELGGWRSTFLSLDTVAAAPVVIAPPGSSAKFVAELAPTIEFAPGAADLSAVRTAAELRVAIESQLG